MWLRGSLVTQKSESNMTAVCTAFSNCGSFQNTLDDTSMILSLIKKSHVPNRSIQLHPLVPSTPLLMVPMQKNWKFALIMLCSMHISNAAAQFRLASEEFMQNDTIYDPLLCGKMVLHAPSDLSIPSLSYFYPLNLDPNYFHYLH